jgi:hypothetical protein
LFRREILFTVFTYNAQLAFFMPCDQVSLGGNPRINRGQQEAKECFNKVNRTYKQQYCVFTSLLKFTPSLGAIGFPSAVAHPKMADRALLHSVHEEN